MAAKKKSTKKIKSLNIEDIRHECAGCGGKTYVSWDDFIVDSRGRKMHRSCVSLVIEKDNAEKAKFIKDIEARMAEGSISLSRASLEYADMLNVKYLIDLEKKHPGLDEVRGRAVMLHPERDRLMRHRNHPLWLEFKKEHE